MIDFKTIFISDRLKKLYRHFTIYTGANFLNQMIPFILLPIMTRFLTPHDYGVWATFMAISGIITVTITMGCTGAVTRGYFDIKKRDFNFSQYLSNAVLINITVFIVVSFLVFLSRSFISERLKIASSWLLFLPVIGVSTAIFSIPLKLFVFKQKPLPYVVMRGSNTFMEILISILFVVIVGLGWRGRVLGVTITKLLFLIIGILLLRGNLLRFSIRRDYIKDIMKFGVPIFIKALCIAAIAATDRIFLNRLVGLSATGIYSVGYSISAIILFLVGAFNLAWRPILYEKLNSANESTRINLVKYTYLLSVVIIVAALTVIFVSPHILKILVGQKFYVAYPFISWLVLANVFYGLHMMMAAYIHFQKKTYLLSIIAAVMVTCNIIFTYSFIRLNGAIGAAQAKFLTFLIGFALIWYCSNRVYPMPWFSFARREA